MVCNKINGFIPMYDKLAGLYKSIDLIVGLDLPNQIIQDSFDKSNRFATVNQLIGFGWRMCEDYPEEIANHLGLDFVSRDDIQNFWVNNCLGETEKLDYPSCNVLVSHQVSILIQKIRDCVKFHGYDDIVIILINLSKIIHNLRALCDNMPVKQDWYFYGVAPSPTLGMH